MKYIVAILIVLVLVYAFGAYNLQFAFTGLGVVNGQPVVTINAFNPFPFAYPVPSANIGVYTDQGDYLGTINLTTWQLINAGTTTTLQAALSPDSAGLITAGLLAVVKGPERLYNLNFNGTIHVGPFNVPLNFSQNIG